MSMEFRQEPELVVEQIQAELLDVRKDLDELTKFIKGNGDPTKGLLWLVADLSRLVAAQGTMSGEVRQAMLDHIKAGHPITADTRNGWWARFLFDIARNVMTVLIIAIGGWAFAVFIIGLKVSVGHP